MKYLTSILIAICLSFFVYKSFYRDVQHKSTNSKFKVIVHFEEDVISDTTLFSTIDAIQNKSIRELLAEYGAIKLKAAFTNRYDTTGFLKSNIKSSLPGAWQQIILSHKNKAEDLIVKLKKRKRSNQCLY